MDIGHINIPWVESPFFEQLLDQSDLVAETRELVRSYAQDGYLIVDPDLPEFDSLASQIIEACSDRPGYPQRLMDEWARVPAIRSLALVPKILDILKVLYRRNPIPMQTLNFGCGTEQAPHSDSMHFSSVPRGFMCGVWVSLEDVDESNGPLEYYPGSHRLPYLDHSHLGIRGSKQSAKEFYPQYEDFIQDYIRELKLERRLFTAPKGQAIIWSANLLHGGSGVKDASKTRHSQVTHYYFEDCLYYQPQRSDPFLGKIEWLDKRDIRTGQLIPQVYNGKRARLPMTLSQRLKKAARRSQFIMKRWTDRTP